MITFNCLDGYFAFPDPKEFSIAETMQRRAGGGSVAAISPAGLGTTDEQQYFRALLSDTMFKDDVREIGQALLLTKQKYYDEQGGQHYLVDTMTLFGDPAMRLPGASNWTMLPLITAN